MNANERADAIIQDILDNHLPRVIEGLKAGYVDENQVLVIYDHAVRARILKEFAEVQLALEELDNLGRLNRELEAEWREEKRIAAQGEIKGDIPHFVHPGEKEQDHLAMHGTKPPYLYSDAVRDAKLAESASNPPTTKLINVPYPGTHRGVLKEVPISLKEEIEQVMAIIVGVNTVTNVQSYVASMDGGLPRHTLDRGAAWVQRIDDAKAIATEWSRRYADMTFSVQVVADLKREPAVPLLKPMPERVWTDRHVVPEKSEFKFILDKVPRTVKVPTLTGVFIKALLPEAKRGYALYQEAEGNDPDIAIHNDSTVNVDGLMLYSVPPATFGAPKLTCVCGGEIKELPTSIEALLKCSACERVYMNESDVAHVKQTETKAGAKFRDATYFTTGTVASDMRMIPSETEINLNGSKAIVRGVDGKFTLTYEQIVRMVLNHGVSQFAHFTGTDAELPMFSCVYHHRCAFELLPGERDGSLCRGQKVGVTPGMSITCMDTSNA